MAAASSSGPTLIETLFQHTLADLTTSLRSPTGPALARAAADSLREARAADLPTKSTAVQKLTFLSVIHFVNVSSSAFHVIELLPSPSFLHKKLAYLAVSLTFSPSTPVLPLATHQLRKDLSSSSDPSVSLALELLSSAAASPDLARDLANAISLLMSSSRTRIRLKAVAASARIFRLCPDSLSHFFEHLVGCLQSDDNRVSAAAVNVFCELSAVDPKPYLPLSPEFFKILVNSRNNWVLIKVLKIFSRLAPLEPRLARRLVEPVSDHLRRSSALSLTFECVRTVFSCLDGFDGAVSLAVEKLTEFLSSDGDPNLRYLGLTALTWLKPISQWAVEQNREIVARSLSDPDPNIRRVSLRLIMSMINSENLIEISSLLIDHSRRSDPEFANEIVAEIVTACCNNFYELVVDFDWFVNLLADVVRHVHFALGDDLELILIDVALRVRDARPELVHVVRGLLIDPSLLGRPALTGVLTAAAWISGEYVAFSSCHVELLEALLQPRVALLPVRARAVYLQAVFKVIIFCLRDQESYGGDSIKMIGLIEASLDPLLESREVELVDRARNVLGFIRSLKRDEDQDHDLIVFVADAFDEELGLISDHDQSRVLIPDGIVLRDDLSDLDAIIGEEFVDEVSSSVSSPLIDCRRDRELFYLGKDEFPPAREGDRSEGGEGGQGGLTAVERLAESLAVKGKGEARKGKARPVVAVKLDGDSGGQPKKSSSRERSKRKSQKSPTPAVPDLLL